MNERLLARLLFGLGILSLSIGAGLFGYNWSTSSPLIRVGLVAATIATVGGFILDIKHRREDKQRDRNSVV